MNPSKDASAGSKTKAALGNTTAAVGATAMAYGSVLSTALLGLEGLSVVGAVVANNPTQRAGEVHSALDPIAQRYRTTAVTTTQEGINIISSSQKRLDLVQQNLLKPGELEGFGTGHAEITGINTARELGLTPTGVAASRPICINCQQTLLEEAIEALSPVK